MNKKFYEIKNEILNLINNKYEVTSKSEYKKGGIYLLYVDNFEDEKIIPIYIGKTNDFQKRHKEHLKELFALNRLSKKYYISAIINQYFEGYYKSCKFFKYMVDKNCTLKNIHMIILEECEDETQRTKMEYDYINKYLTSFFGFNQINSISLQNDYITKGTLSKFYLSGVENDILNIIEYPEYGYNEFNYMLAKGLFEQHKPNMKDKLSSVNKFDNINNIKGEYIELIKQQDELIHWIKYTSENESIKFCGDIIDSYFEKNNLKSEDKKKQLIQYLLFNDEKDKKVLEKYIRRFTDNSLEDILSIINNACGKKIANISNTIKEYQKRNYQYNKRIYELLLVLYKDIIPNKEYNNFPLKDTYYPINMDMDIEDNTLYLNIEVSNHGRKKMNDDYPCILKIDYSFNKNGLVTSHSYYIKSDFDNFFDNNDEYYIKRDIYNSFHVFDPFNIWKYSKEHNYNTISTSMEYYNGINEFTLFGKEKHEVINIIKEIDSLINDSTKIIYISGNKSLIKEYKNVLPESILLQKIPFYKNENKKYKSHFKKNSEDIIENLKYELSKKIKKDDSFKICTNKSLRINYIKKLLTEILEDKYKPLKNLWVANTPKGIYNDAINFVEIVWKEYKNMN